MYVGRVKITLAVRNVRASVDNYQRLLAFTLRGYRDDESGRLVVDWTAATEPCYAEMLAGENVIGLTALDLRTRPAPVEVTIDVADLDLFQRRLASQRAGYDWQQVDDSGRRSLRFIDRDGYAWVLRQDDRRSD